MCAWKTAKGSAVTLTYSAFEVFEIAEQVERNGAEFYRAAARLAGDSQVCKTLLDLAEWEIRHEKIFARMKCADAKPDRGPDTAESAGTLAAPKAMAGLAVFSIKTRPSWQLRSESTQTDVLKAAVKNERDTAAFYNGLKNFVRAGAEQEKIDDIIREEMRHIAILERLLKKTD